jgi:hypothetical protein
MHLWPCELTGGRIPGALIPFDNYAFAMAWLDAKYERQEIENEINRFKGRHG